MKQLLVTLFFIPSLLFAMKEKDCLKVRDKILSSWNQCDLLIQQINQTDPNQDLYLQLLDQSIAHCRTAISLCDKILDDIAGKSKKHREEYWCKQMKEGCKKDKQACVQRLNELLQVRDNLCFQRAITLYQESSQLVTQANELTQLPEKLDQIETIIENLQTASTLYRKASLLLEQALQWLVGSSREGEKAILQSAILEYKEASEKALQMAIQLPFEIPPQTEPAENSTPSEEEELPSLSVED